MPKCRIKVGVISAMLLCWSAAIGQGQNSATPQPVAKSGTEDVPYTFKAATRLVVVDVVAKDAHNQPVRDLTEADFRVFEKQGSLEESPQKISAFRFVDGAAPRPPIETAVTPVPHGTYTNLVATRDLPVPPTVLLIDALNTALSSSHIEIRQRLLRMTDSIPGNVPVAVFLLGAQPQMVQNFTTDSKAIHHAVATALGVHVNNTSEFSNRPYIVSPDLQEMFGVPAANMAAIKPQNSEWGGDYAKYMDDRVKGTTNGFRTLARYLAGYPGRKNLIWVSASFPFSMLPDKGLGMNHDRNLEFDNTRNYFESVRSFTRALEDARVSVYPVDVQGVWTLEGWSAEDKSAPPIGPLSTFVVGQVAGQYAYESTELQVAELTGGQACLVDNDLGDCVKKAFDDGLSYYEIAYYPAEENWREGFHEISVKTPRPGVHLSFRRGYSVGNPGKQPERKRKTADNQTIVDPNLRDAACKDTLTATSLPMRAQAVPASHPGQLKYLLTVDGKNLSFTPQAGGNQKLQLDFAICTFDAEGRSLQYMQDDVDQTMPGREFQSVTKNGFPHMLEFSPPERSTQIRLVARDAQSGLLGSLDLQYEPAISVQQNSSQSIK